MSATVTRLKQRKAEAEAKAETIQVITLDIETESASAAEIEMMVAAWQPKGNVKKQETIDAQCEAYRVKCTEKSALTDAAPIASVAIKTNRGVCEVFSALPDVGLDQVIGFDVIQGDDEKDMLEALLIRLEELASNKPTIITGHNIKGFDLTKIRNRAGRYKIRLPFALLPYKTQLFDTQQLAKHYSTDLADDPMPSFAQVAVAMGMDIHKSDYSGAQVPIDAAKARALVADGKASEAKELIETILTYNALDADSEHEAALFMGAQYPVGGRNE